MKFGDIVVNTSASPDNPIKTLMFVKRSGRYLYTLSTDGETVKFYANDKGYLKVAGAVDFSVWHRIAEIEPTDA